MMKNIGSKIWNVSLVIDLVSDLMGMGGIATEWEYSCANGCKSYLLYFAQS